MSVQFLITLGRTLLTSAAFQKLVVHALWDLAQRSEGTDLDDEAVQTVASALSVELPPKKPTQKSA